MLKVIVLSMLIFFSEVNSHGTLLEPPNRSTLWRLKEEDPFIKLYQSIVEENWTDNQLFCGGFTYQQNLGGKCGLCGDPYDGVRENEAGGKYGKGIIVRKYPQGSIMAVTVVLTAHHVGWFEFRLCVWNNPTVPGTFDCLNKNLLKLENGETHYFPDKSASWTYKIKLQLPEDVNCTQCILQWKYHAGNSWNCDEDGNCGMGIGPQEEFYGCADIAIGDVPVLPPPGWDESLNSTNTTTTSSAITATTTTTNTADSTPTTTTTSSAITTTTTTTNTDDSTPTTTTSTVSTTSGSTSTSPDPTSPSCQGKPAGEYKLTCTTYYTCLQNDEGPFKYTCPPGTFYDQMRKMCDWDYNVPPPCGTKDVSE